MLNRNIFSRSRISRIIIYAIVTTTILFLSAAGSNVAVLSFSDQGSRTATPVTCTPPPSGLVSWWTGDGHSRDIRGANHGTLMNGATYASGEVASSFSFNGINHYLSIPQAAVLPVRGTSNFTIEAWINHQGDASNDMFNVFAYRNGGQDVQFFITRTHIGIWGTGAAGMIILTPHNVNAALWNHYAFTRGGNIWRVYVNGNQVGGDVSNAVNILTPTTPQNIGTTGLANTQFAKGAIDEISVYDRELNQLEIQAIYNSQSAGKCTVCTPAPVGLAAWYQGESNVLDSRSGFNGTMQNGAGFAAGKVGQGFSFDGVDDFVSAPNDPALDPISAGSMGAWVKFNQLPSNAARIMQIIGKGGSGMDFDLQADPDDRFRFFIAAGTNVPSTTVIQTGFWYHVMGSWDSTVGLKIYVNGVLENTNPTLLTRSPSGQPLHIGHHAVFPGRFFNGDIDEVSIYNRALTAAEIQSIAFSGKSGMCSPTATIVPPGLVGWWGGDGDARDYSSIGNDGTLGSTAGFSIGKIGQAFAFNGTQDSVVTNRHHSLFGVNPSGFTTEFWMKSNGTQPENLATLVDKSHGFVDSTGWAFTAFSSTNTVHFAIGDGGAGVNSFVEAISNPGVLDGNYHHIAGTWDGSNMHIYVDGVLNGTTPMTNPANNGRGLNFAFSWGNGFPQRFFNGNLDEVSIYSRSLSLSEIQSIYNAGLAGKLKSVATPANVFTKRRGMTFRNELGIPGIQLGDATVTLQTISTDGVTQQIPLDLSKLPALPMGYTPANLTYDIATSATWSGTATVCFNLPSLTAQFANLHILHLENGSWAPTVRGGMSPNLCASGLTSLSPFTIVTAAPTAAAVSLGGRVQTANGQGIRNAIVTLSGPRLPQPLIARTGSFGYYRFVELQAGETYVVTINSKRYTFQVPSRVLTLVDNVADADFIADPME